MPVMFTIWKFKSLNRTVTLETFNYEGNKIFNAILCQWHYYIPNLTFLAPSTTITNTPPINRNLGNANYFKLLQLPPPKFVISTWNATKPSLVKLPNNSDLEHRFSRPKLKFCGHHINWFNAYLIFSRRLTSYTTLQKIT